MSKITILPDVLINKIAAGEVIERPASVVKELLENSIDAGSTGITVEILRGGKGLIKVTDNGTGMDSDDALLSLQRHATSKLRTEKDLFNIETLGFRGEALPSIASVSRMKLVTGLRGAPSGVSIEMNGGQIGQMRDCPAAGTSVEMRDLFFNTPARKKFLKSDSTELFHIIDAVTREALSRWDIGFRLFTETHETMNLPRASGPRERVLQIYGLEFIEGLMEVTAEDRTLRMTAFVTKGERPRVFNRLRIEPPLPPNYKYQRKSGMYLTDIWEDIRELTSGYFAGDEAVRDKEGNRVHKQQTPVALLLRIILTSSMPKDTVFDPMAGTGTTAVVANQLKRRPIVVEIDPEYVELIESRLETLRPSDDIVQYLIDYGHTPNLESIAGMHIDATQQKLE